MNSVRIKRMVLALALFFVASSVGADALAQGKPRIHITYSENMYATIAVVAIEKGFLAAQGLEVKHASEGSATEVLEALVGGSTDFGVASTSRIMAMASKNLPVRAIALNAYGFTGSLVLPRRDLATKAASDLKGKKIGVQRATGTYAVWARYLKAQGMSTNDFTVIDTKNGLIPAAMESGSIDAAVSWEPSPSRLVAKGLGRILLGPDDLAGPANSTYPFFLITSSKMIEQKPEVVQKVVNGWNQSLKYIRENPDEVARIMQESMKKTQGISMELDQAKKDVFLTKYDRLAISEADIKDTEEIARVFVEEGKIKSLPDIRSVVDNRFAEKAQTPK